LEEAPFAKEQRKKRTRYYNSRKSSLKEYLKKRERLREEMDFDEWLARWTYRDNIPKTEKYNEKGDVVKALIMERNKHKYYQRLDIEEEIFNVQVNAY